jgi:hypothetical protein
MPLKHGDYVYVDPRKTKLEILNGLNEVKLFGKLVLKAFFV